MVKYDLEPLLEQLRENADPGYAAFTQKLIPNASERILGVRMPVIRRYAKRIARSEDWPSFLEVSRVHPIYEIRMLHGIVLATAGCDFAEKIALTDRFLPWVDNWALCDGFCASFKYDPQSSEAWFDFICACAQSDEEYRMRFGLVMLMNHYRAEPWIDRTMAIYRGFQHDAFYARMAAAWGLATLWLYAREQCLGILQDQVWDPFTHNMAIRKICESDRVSKEDKACVRALRRGKD